MFLEDQDLLDEASLDVDALVADANEDVSFPIVDPFGFSSVRSSTPSVPPGFGPPGFTNLPLPHGHPDPVLREAPSTVKPPSRIVPTSAPFTPSRSSPFVPGNSTTLANASGLSTPAQTAVTSKAQDNSVAQAKQDVKALAGSSGLSKTIASQHVAPANLQSTEDFPALESSKAKPTPSASSAKTTPAVKISSIATASKKVSTPSSAISSPLAAKTTEKKINPAVLNIVTSPSKADTAEKREASSSFPPLPPSTPSASAFPVHAQTQSSSRATTTTAKMTKAVSKAETPMSGVTPSSTTSAFPPSQHPSRQASLASVAKPERSGTPTSEIISDNASITSASISRASSPPPSKIGSAPVRANTKSMQKKQRKELQKEKEKQEFEAVAAKAAEPEPEIGPIMGRKKKQKKERIVSGAAGASTPVVSRPASPSPGSSVVEDATKTHVVGAPSPVPDLGKQAPSSGSSPVKAVDSKSKSKAKAAPRAPTPELSAHVSDIDEEPEEKPIPTPASIFQDLISSGSIPDINDLSFLKTPSVNTRHHEQADLESAIQKLTITAEDRATLLAGKPVHKIDGPNRIMLTPNGDCVRNLTAEEEQRYLALQASVAAEAGPAAFYSVKHHTSGGFTLVGGRAVANGPPSFFPQMSAPMDPVAKIQREEALSYINQYVLPSLSTNSQLEKALNANALDAEMLRTSEASAWASWGSDPPKTGEEAYEGILASGLEHMTHHFAVGRDIDRGQPLGNVSMLSLAEAENALQLARKETESLEKRLNALVKKNRKLLLGSGH